MAFTKFAITFARIQLGPQGSPTRLNFCLKESTDTPYPNGNRNSARNPQSPKPFLNYYENSRSLHSSAIGESVYKKKRYNNIHTLNIILPNTNSWASVRPVKKSVGRFLLLNTFCIYRKKAWFARLQFAEFPKDIRRGGLRFPL